MEKHGIKEIRPYLIVFSAVLSFLCFPPFPFGPLILLTIVPLLLAIEDLTPVAALKSGFIWGLIFYFGMVFYIAWVTIAGMIATVLVLSLIPAAGSWIFARLMRRNRGVAVVFFPSYFITWNWLFTMSDLNYPWTDLGYSLGYYTKLIQAADIGGVYLITAFILIVNILVYISFSGRFQFKSRSKTYLRIAAVLIICMFYAYGWTRITKGENEHHDGKLRVGLLQGNMTEDLKWEPKNLFLNFQTYFRLSRQAASDGAQLIVWPETAIPEYFLQKKYYYDMVRHLVDSLDVPVLSGTPYYQQVGEGQYIFFNSAVLLTPGQDSFTVYFKNHLVPISEKIPFRENFKVLREIRLGQADWSNGTEQTIFKLNGYKFATAICFESVFPDYCRRFAQKGAQFLVVITNDMWFGRTTLMEQHAMMSVFRAIENRIPVVRSANTGISMAIDKWGRVHARSKTFEEACLMVEIEPENSDSVYGRIGNVVPHTAGLLCLISIPFAFIRRRDYITEAI